MVPDASVKWDNVELSCEVSGEERAVGSIGVSAERRVLLIGQQAQLECVSYSVKCL